MIFNIFELRRASNVTPQMLNALLEQLEVKIRLPIDREVSEIELEEMSEAINAGVRKLLNSENISYALRNILKQSNLSFDGKTIGEMIHDIVKNEQTIKHSFKRSQYEI